MHWGAYEVFSVMSGIVLIIVALVPGAPGKERFWAFLAGAFFVAHGIFVASRTSGTWLFPVWIFVIPFAGIAYLVYRLVTLGTAPTRRRPAAGGPAEPLACSTPVYPRLAAPARGPFCSQCGARADRDAAYCGQCVQS